MIYGIGRDESTGQPIDLSDTHSRLGRMAITRRVALSDATVLALVLAENSAGVAAALTEALSVAEGHDEPQASTAGDAGAAVAADDTAAADGIKTSAEPEPRAAEPHDDEKSQPPERGTPRRRRSTRRLARNRWPGTKRRFSACGRRIAS